MKAILCKICGGYGLDRTDGVCSICLNAYEHVAKEPTKPTCAYCGKPASQLYLVWVNGGRVEKNFCDNKCANNFQKGAEG